LDSLILCLSWLDWSLFLSLPAKSINYNIPSSDSFNILFLILIILIAWDLDDESFLFVDADDLYFSAFFIDSDNESSFRCSFSTHFVTSIFPYLFSNIFTLFGLFCKSYTSFPNNSIDLKCTEYILSLLLEYFFEFNLHLSNTYLLVRSIIFEIVYVFPDPVCPNAIIVPTPPSITVSIIDLQ